MLSVLLYVIYNIKTSFSVSIYFFINLLYAIVVNLKERKGKKYEKNC